MSKFDHPDCFMIDTNRLSKDECIACLWKKQCAHEPCSTEPNIDTILTSKEKWDRRFIDLAYTVATWSKDPSTKCGAVIVDNKIIVSMGFNGFPQTVQDNVERYNDRILKLKMVLHAEINALIFKNRSVEGCTLYVIPMPPCSRCAVQIIQNKISRVVTIKPSAELVERWGEDFKITEQMFKEAGIYLKYIQVH